MNLDDCLPQQLRIARAVTAAREAAMLGPCSKSKRGATAFAVDGPPIMVARCNAPPDPFRCTGTLACRAACASVCNHAEQRALAAWRELRSPQPFDVLHLEVIDGRGVAFDREGKPKRPSCIVCAREMYTAGVRLVWLKISCARDGDVGGFKAWTAHDFMRDTLLELGVPEGELPPAAPLPASEIRL